MEQSFYVHGRRVGNMNASLMMEKKKSYPFESILHSGSNGYQSDGSSDGTMTNYVMEGYTIERLMNSPFSNQWLIFTSGKPTGLTQIIIDGISYALTEASSTTYFFNFSDTFINGHTYEIALTRE
jgi:hypothetical protein